VLQQRARKARDGAYRIRCLILLADHDYWKKVCRVATVDYLSKILTEHRVH
jgi:hypothetical protein